MVGAGLRFWNLDLLPPGCYSDEAENGLETLRILAGDFFVFTPRNNGRGALQFWVCAPLFKWFGAEVTVLRMASALAGTATILAAWFLYRVLAGSWTALLATAFLAGSGWHLTVSRVGFDVAFTPLLDALAVGALLLALRTGRLAGFVAAGAFAGVAQYGYYASRLTPLLLVLVGAISVLRGSIQPAWKRGAILALATFTLVVGPLALYALRNPDRYMARSRRIGISRLIKESGSVQPLIRSVHRTARMFHQRGDWNPRHNLRGRPMLDPVTGLVFLAGLSVAVRRRDDPAVGATVGWLALVLVTGGVLTAAAPHANRNISAVLPVCLIAAWGTQALALRLLPGKRAAGIATAVLAAGALMINAQGYFSDYARMPRLDHAFSGPSYRVGLHLRGLPDGRPAMVSKEFSPNVVRFVAQREEGSLGFASRDCIAPDKSPSTVYVFRRRGDVSGELAEAPFAITEFPAPEDGGFVVVERTADLPAPR